MPSSVRTALTPELLVSSLDDSLKFYLDVMGFTVQYQRPETRFAMLERQGARLMIDEFAPTGKRPWIAGPLEKPFGRGINLEIQTTDIDALYARVQAAGIPIFLPIEDRWYRADDEYSGCRQFIVLDPDGYMLRMQSDIGTRTRAEMDAAATATAAAATASATATA